MIVSNLFLTLVIAFVAIVFAIAFLAIGWLITGKTKVEKNHGIDPNSPQDNDLSQSCKLCTPSSEQDLKDSSNSHLI